MKRFLLFWTIIAMALAVSAQERTNSNNANDFAQRETHVTTTEALNVGYTFMRTGGDTRSSNVRKQDLQLIYAGQAIDSLSQEVTDCYYVFALQPKGFVIVAADERVEPILGYSYDNNFVVANMPDHVRGWLGNYEKQIEAVVKQNIAPEVETTTKWSRLKSGQSMSTRSGETVGPLLTTTWDQGQYYNAMCPEDAAGPDGHVYTGCVATAMAQIINYHQYPQHGRGSHSYYNNYGTLTVNYDSANYNYTLMPNALTSTSTTAGVNAVATLMRDCGVAVNMQYNAGESSAYAQEARAALMNFFKFSPNMSFAEKEYFTNDEWETMLRNDLDAGNPVYYSGQGAGGHAFVCDGYNANGYFSFNFGWSGYCNGWYLTSNVNPGGNIFNDSQSAIFGIVPDANGNVILGQMAGTSTFTVDEPLEFYHLMGHNSYEGSNYTNPCNNTVTFVSANDATQVVADIIEYEDQNLTIYDGDYTWLRSFYGGSDNDLSPVVSTQHVLNISYQGNLFYAGFRLNISQDNGCRMVSNIVTSVDTTTVHLAWTENGSATQWEIEYGEEGFSHGNGTILVVNTTATNITFPQKLTKYDVYIRSVCGENVYGPWKKMPIFSEAPYWQDIVTSQPESYSVDEMTNCAIITCAEDFVWYIKTGTWSYEAQIVSDIDLGGYKWRPINNTCSGIHGNNHIISNLYINEGFSHTGLFATVYDPISNLGIENAYVSGGGDRTGAFCAELSSSGSLINCHISNSSIVGNYMVGGLVGANYGMIKNCYADVNIKCRNQWAGLLTANSQGSIFNCYANGTINIKNPLYYAGITGYAGGIISNCYSSDLPNGVVDQKGNAIITDTSSFYKNGNMWELLSPVEFDGNAENDLLTALNKGVSQINESNLNTWIASNNEYLPVFGDLYIVQCPNPANLTLQNALINNESCVIIDWEELGNSENWEIKYQRIGTSSDSVTILTVNSKPDTIYDIPLGNEYSFSVRSVCDENNRSGWVSKNEIVDLPFWTDIVTSCPEGYVEDAEGNVSISTAEGLAWFAVLVNGFHGNEAHTFENKSVSVISDINLQGYRWFPVGRGWYANPQFYTRFNGLFRGNGHVISGMYVNSDGPYLGLFGYAGYGSGLTETEFIDIVLTDGSVNCYHDDSGYGGCGGLIGWGEEIKEIRNCFSGISVSGARSVGSLCGRIDDFEGECTTISNCTATGNVFGRESYGGLIGEARGALVQNCYATGNLMIKEGNSELMSCGGLIGNMTSNTIVKNCYSSGNIEIPNDEPYSYITYGKVLGQRYMSTLTENVYGLIDDILPLSWLSVTNDIIIDTSFFYDNNNQQVLTTPITIDEVTYDNLLDVLNAWVKQTNNPELKKWSEDTSNINNGYPIFGDNFEPTCYNPINVSVTNASAIGDSIIRTKIEWEQQGNPDNWEILYVATQQSIDSGMIIPVTSNPCIITDLPLGELLDIYVRAICDSSDFSGWSKAVSYIPDKLHWTEVVTSQPDGYQKDDDGNVYISSAEGLAWLSSVMNKLNGNDEAFYPQKIILTSDIDISAYRWTTIGELYDCIFDGKGHVIRGLYCNENASYQGLFGKLFLCTIQNLKIYESAIYGLQYNGTLAGFVSGGTINNCIVNGEIYGVAYTGGICGEGSNTISNSAFIGMVDTRPITISNTYNGFIGGITGLINGSQISNSYVAAEIPWSIFSGVIVGPEYGTISNVYAKSYQNELGLTFYNAENNSSFFTGNSPTWILNNPSYIGGSFHSNLVDALNAWVDANNSEGIYRHWAADSANVNGGFPVFAAPQTYTLTLAINSATPYGEVSGGGTYNEFDNTAIISATAQEGYHFVQWNDGNTDNPRAVVLTKDSILTAQFGVNMYSVVGATSTSVDFFFDFEDVSEDAKWTLLNDNYTNRWYINMLDDNRTLYISNDYGASNDYDEYEPSSVFAYTTLLLDSGQYNFSYDWRCNAESHYDYLRVALIPNSVTLDNTDNTWSAYTLPNDAISLDNEYQLAGQSTWANQSGTIEVNSADEYKMVFHWHNDGSVKNVPPAAVDNIHLYTDGVDYSAMGTVLGSDTVPYLDTVTLTAVPNPGYRFVQWDDENTDNPRVVVATNNKKFVAIFECLPVIVIDSIITCDSYSWKSVDYFESTVLFDTLTNATGCDSVVTLYLTINHATISDTNVVACDNYTWNGTTYAESGDYSQTFTNASGCDSIVTLHLTINYSNTGIDEQTACEAFTWIDGVTYTESTNTPTFTLTNAAGCDSVVTLNLTVNYGTHNAETEVACDSYEWHGESYTMSGTHTYEYTNEDGCPSVDTLYLTINYSTSGIDEQTACESFTWIDGVTYSESTNEPTYTLTNAAGCDSVVTLNLTVNYGTHNIETEVVCDSYEWYGETYATTGVYTYEYTNADGCPSVDTLYLTVNYSTTGIDEQTACESFTWIDGVTYTESTDTPTYTLTNAAGCDSVVTLHLTVNYGTHNTETEVACDSYEWNGETYATTGVYTYEYTNADGCPSVDTLHLTINYSTTGIDEQTACESFTWIDGVTYTESTNTPTFTLTNAAGCDSVVALHLTVNYGTHNAETEVACDSYEWNDETYTTTGVYTYEYTNEDGCPSVDTLYLTINYSTTGIDEQTACESFTWIDGVTYTESTNTPTFTLTNAAGCDSVVTLNLTVHYGTHNAETEVVCDSYEWNDETYTTTGVYTYEYTNADGCPSVDTLYLTINYSTTGIDEQTACESFTWIDGVTYTESTNEPTFTLTNAAGCDSVVTLNLTIYESTTSEFSIVTDDPCYTWNGIDYCESGDYTQTLQTVHGCDSVVTLHLTITVGLDDHETVDFKVFPNPTTGVVNVECTMNNVQLSGAEIQVVDMYGKLVDVVGANNYSPIRTAQIDLSLYASGIYFVKAVADGETIAVRKVVKQ